MRSTSATKSSRLDQNTNADLSFWITAQESVTMAMSTFARTTTQRNTNAAKYMVDSGFRRRSWKNFSSTEPDNMYHTLVMDVTRLQNGEEPPSVGSQLVTYLQSRAPPAMSSQASV